MIEQQPTPAPAPEPAWLSVIRRRVADALAAKRGAPVDDPAQAVRDRHTLLTEVDRLGRVIDDWADKYQSWRDACLVAREERDTARAQADAARRALAGHLFDGESVSTREAIRSELILMGLHDRQRLDAIRAAFAAGGTDGITRGSAPSARQVLAEVQRLLDPEVDPTAEPTT